MSDNHFEPELKHKLRAYFLHCKSLFRTEYHHDTLRKMSPQLRGEVANHENSGWVMSIGFFAQVPEEEQMNLITEIAVMLRSCVYCPSDTVVHEGSPNNVMYIVQRGVCVLKLPGAMAQFRTMGSCFGQDMIINLVTGTLRRKYVTTALTYSDLQMLDCDAFEAIITSGVFPKTFGVVRRAATKMLFKMYFLDYVTSSQDDVVDMVKTSTYGQVVHQMIVIGKERNSTIATKTLRDPSEKLAEASREIKGLSAQSEDGARRVTELSTRIMSLERDMKMIKAYIIGGASEGAKGGAAGPAGAPVKVKGKGGVIKNEDDLDVEDFEEIATKHSSQSGMRVQALEERMDRLQTFVAVSREGNKGLDTTMDMGAEIDDLEKKQQKLRGKIKKDIRAFNETQVKKEQSRNP